MQQIDINIFFIIASVRKHFKLFIAITIIATLISAVIAYIIPVQYESKAFFYPYSPEASDPRNFLYDQIGIGVYSNSDETEKFMTIANSKMVKLQIVEKYNLFKRYNIDTVNHAGEAKVIHELTSKVKLKKEENGGLMLSVLDRNSDTAAMIANEFVSLIEKHYVAKTREKNQKVFNIYENHYQKMDAYINSLKDSLSIIRRKQKNFNAENEVGLSKQIEFAMEEYTKSKFKYEQALSMLSFDLKAMLVIEPAYPSYKKAQPNRVMIVGITFLAVMLIASILLATLEYLKSGLARNSNNQS